MVCVNAPPPCADPPVDFDPYAVLGVPPLVAVADRHTELMGGEVMQLLLAEQAKLTALTPAIRVSVLPCPAHPSPRPPPPTHPPTHTGAVQMHRCAAWSPLQC